MICEGSEPQPSINDDDSTKHFLGAADESAKLLRPCKEEPMANGTEPEVRKQVGWHPAALKAYFVRSKQRRVLAALTRGGGPRYYTCRDATYDCLQRSLAGSELRPRI